MKADNIGKREKIFYLMGILGQNMIYNFMAMYMLFFFTDILSIPAATASLILVLATLWDAINDPIMGVIADHTNTRFGKFRPYLFFSSLPTGLFTILCFTNFRLSPNFTVVIMSTIYVLWGMIYTSTDIPIWALSSVSSSEQRDRNNLITLGKIGAMVGVVIVTVSSVPALKFFGGERKSISYTLAALLFGGTGSLMMFFLAFFSKERIKMRSKELSVKHNLSIVYRNKPLLLLLISLFTLNFSNSIRQSVQIYFAIYVWGDAGYATLFGLALVLGMGFGMALTPYLISKSNKKKVFVISCLWATVFSLLPYFIDYLNVPLGLISIMLDFFFVGIAMVSSTSMLVDTIDYGERKLGARCEGIVFSMNTFVTKLGGSASKLMLGAVMVSLLYVENMESTPLLKKGFSFVVYIIPALSFMICMLPMFFYHVEENNGNNAH